MRLVIIGGSDAGISAALRAREFAPGTDITVVLADEFPNYSICGLPFFLSGETPDAKQLAHRTEFEGIRLLTNHKAVGVEAKRSIVIVQDKKGQRHELGYDQLVIGSGAEPVTPPISGFRTPGVYPLHTMEHSFAVKRHLEEKKPRTAAVVGAGYIGVEMADALTVRGLEVTLIGKAKAVLPTVDADLGALVDEEFRRRGVEVVNETQIHSIKPDGPQIRLMASSGFEKTADLVLVAVGVKPVTHLAVSAGISIGKRGAIRVNRGMKTEFDNIYAAGDCAETWHRLLNRYTYLPLGTTSHKQGRVAGENAVGGKREFQGSVGTQVVKVFDLAVARTGLREAEAREAGFDPFTREVRAWDHKAYYPGAHEMRIRITGDKRSGRLLGAQIVGHWQAQVAKRVDIFATALFVGMKVDEISDLDLSYTPPLSSPWDPVQIAGQAWSSGAPRDFKEVPQSCSH
jgi:NADPH-dependent 2,4-dienoyl-CoA reductase/sulfur reductase-like enzyme